MPGWSRWFAWRPVEVVGGGWVWLEVVEVFRHWDAVEFPSYYRRSGRG